MSVFHLVLSCLTAFVVTNYPAPMEMQPAILVGIACAFLGYVLTLRDESAQTQETVKDDTQ